MPVKSRAQARLMEMVASGEKKVNGLSQAKAKEFLEKSAKIDELPERTGPQKQGRVLRSKKARVIR